MMGRFNGETSTTCSNCNRVLDVTEPRWKLLAFAHGGRHQSGGTIDAHLCERCTKISKRAWDKNRALAGKA